MREICALFSDIATDSGRAVVMARGDLITFGDLPFAGEVGDDKEGGSSLPEQVEELERMAIARALEEARGVQIRAAEIPGSGERNPRCKRKRYGLKQGGLKGGWKRVWFRVWERPARGTTLWSMGGDKNVESIAI
ncbi:MAG: hypothetical protein HOC74_22155 [Gemmatimonadetes bacterium]|nr:hypothetical protein [Gemmatimonadota bacterium]